jgi:hypothetical protein
LKFQYYMLRHMAGIRSLLKALYKPALFPNASSVRFKAREQGKQLAVEPFHTVGRAVLLFL